MSDYQHKLFFNIIRIGILLIILFSMTACSWPKVRIKDDEYLLRPAQGTQPTSTLQAESIVRPDQ